MLLSGLNIKSVFFQQFQNPPGIGLEIEQRLSERRTGQGQAAQGRGKIPLGLVEPHQGRLTGIVFLFHQIPRSADELGVVPLQHHLALGAGHPGRRGPDGLADLERPVFQTQLGLSFPGADLPDPRPVRPAGEKIVSEIETHGVAEVVFFELKVFFPVAFHPSGQVHSGIKARLSPFDLGLGLLQGQVGFDQVRAIAAGVFDQRFGIGDHRLGIRIVSVSCQLSPHF